MKRIEHWKIISILLMIFDYVAVVLSYSFSLWIRFDCRVSLIPREYFNVFRESILVVAIVAVVLFWLQKLYRSIWRFASYEELYKVLLANGISILFTLFYTTVVCGSMPISYYVFGSMFQLFSTIGIRFSYRFVLLLRDIRRNTSSAVNVMVIGGGAAGQIIIRDIKASKRINENIACIIDDNSNKWGRYIDGIIVEGGRDVILSAVEKYSIKKIYIAIPSASKKDRRDILSICKETECELKNLPGVYQLSSGEVTVSKMRDVAIEDLLGRDPIKVEMKEVFDFIRDKSIIVTGGGGSIGSELCRQIAMHEPKELIIFDIYENNAYDIQQELKKKYPKLNLVTLIGSVRDSKRVNQVFRVHKPDIVFHAAAHKHVPLMEDSPCESIKNNVFGTFNVAYSAMINGVSRFVLISTDKAVNPTNVMGATKRICEMIIQTFDKAVKEKNTHNIDNYDYGHEKCEFSADSVCTEFVAVRFGNVLGSNGSVIPLFKKQIESGGPVTVTHPDIIRYFMTIPEAVSLVLQAGTYANGGEIFVLDMGEPVKIVDLAKNLIRLSGHKLNEDVSIEFTGLRPGEKLFEEKLMDEEGLRKTKNELIHIGNPIPFDENAFLSHLLELRALSSENDDENIRHCIKKTARTYNPDN